MTPRGADRQSRHHRPLRHPRLRRRRWPSAKPEERPEPDRPVRRRLLLRLHGGRPGRGDLAPGRRRGGLDLGVRGRGELHHRAGRARARAGTDIVLHLKPDAEEYLEPIRLETIVRKWADHITLPITIARDGKDSRPTRAPRCGASRRPRSPSEDYDRILPPSRPHVRQALGDAALARRGRAGILRAAVRPGHASRSSRSRSERQSQGPAACAAHVHHRRGRAAAAVAALRQGVVDTEDLPLNVSREMLQTTPVLARIRKAVTNRVLTELKIARQGRRGLRQVLGEFRRRAEGGHLGGFRAPQGRRAAAALPQSSAVEGWTSLPDYVGADEAGAGGDLFPGRRQRRRAGEFAAARRLPRARARGAAADRPDRRVLAGAAGQFEGKPIRSVTQGAADLSKFEPTRAGGRGRPTSPPWSRR